MGGLSVFLSVVLIPIIAAIAIPNLLRSRMAANESAAVGSLKTIAAQQAIFKQQVAVDQDGDGVGEYGYLCELCGELTPRNKNAQGPVIPVYISQAFATGGSAGDGVGERSGYCFRIYLVGKGGRPGDDSACDGSSSKPSTQLDPKADQAAIDGQEKHFVIYAWPIEVNSTGMRAFVVNEIGEVYGTRMTSQVYAGPNGPSMEAAFSAKGDGSDGWLNDKIASCDGDAANDGNVWVPLGL